MNMSLLTAGRTASLQTAESLLARSLRPGSPALALCMALILLLGKGNWAQADSVEQWTRWETTLTSSTNYPNPFLDVLVSVTYSGPDGQGIEGLGFWDGGDTFKLRCAFPASGTWTYRTTCSDTSNTGLHNRRGTVTVHAYPGKNPLYQHGFLKVSTDQRSLVHADDTPFLWLGETLWGASVWLSEAGWRNAINTLRAKRFNALQLNFARKAELDLDGQSPWSGDRWNLRFMQKLDRMFDYANDQGVYLFVNGLIDLRWDRGISAPFFERMLKMVAARYFAHYVGYSSSMDDPFSKEHIEVNQVLKSATRRHLLTQHAGATDPYPPYGNMWTALQYHEEPSEDYVMVETGGVWQWYFNPAEPSLVSLYGRTPPKPIVNGEAGYEGEPGITAEDCARYAWATFLSGGCGFTHGTRHWSATDATLPAWAASAGQTYMMHAYDGLMNVNGGRCLTPRHRLVLNQPTAWANRMPVAATDDMAKVVAHLPQGGTIELNLSELPREASVEWYDPLTGEYTAGGTVTPGMPRSFTSPFGSNQAVLLLKTDKPASRAAGEPDVRPGVVVFYVSPQGNDAWSGRVAAPRKTDGPFATVRRAQQAVRETRKTQPDAAVRVTVRAGTYYLERTLEFGPEDSGSEEAPVVYAAAADEKVVVSGGRRIAGGRWGEANGQKAWTVDIPEVKEGIWRFRQLFVNGECRPRTRLPKEGEFRIESLPGYTGDFLRSPTKQFVYAPGNIVPTWHNLRDVEIVGITRWLDNRLPIESVNGGTRTVTFDRPTLFALVSSAVSGDGTTTPSVYWIENVFEALDTAGQWYLDRPQGQLYYLPQSGEEMLSAEIIAPRLPQVVRVVGRPGAPAHDLRFEGITFSHTEWQPPADYASSLQAGIEVPGALLFDYAERCAVTDGGIEHIGNYGVEVGVGCADIEIARNRITDIGAGGIRIGHFFSWETDGYGQLTERGIQRKAAMPKGPHSHRITVADNVIAHCGRFTPEAVGVFVGDNANNKIIHNYIYDLFYSGISVGSVQDFGPNHAQGNIVEYNHIHDIGQGLLSDVAGIYTCSTPGTRIRYNRVHDVSRRDYGGWGIYPDQGSHDLLIQNNLVYRCQDGALFAHHNQNITAENNIFAFNRAAQVERGGIGGFELIFQRNLIYYLEGRAVGSYGIERSGRDVCAFDRNLYWNASGKPVLFGDMSFSEWQAAGQDKDGLTADPLFIAPEEGDFRLHPGSPAVQIGFEPWDPTVVGPRPHPAASKQKPVAALADTGSAPAQAAPSIGKHKVLELIFTAAGTPANPFDTYLLKLEVTDPEGHIFTVEGFYDGDRSGGQTGRTWKVRLCPYRTGRWAWRTVPGDAPDGGLEGLTGQFDCVESGDLGGLVAQGKYFRLQDGDFFFPVGNFLDHASGLPLWSYFGETVSNAQRDAIIRRHSEFHTANKYMFYMSNHSDTSEKYSEVVTPWLGTAADSDKTRMDLSRWKLYDSYLRRMKDSGLSAYMSIFEDGKTGNYGRLPMADRKRFMRYAMARTSAFSHVWYVLCFEWQEAWGKTEVNEAGKFIQAYNPWKRPLSVHDWAGTPWALVGETWPTYIASQDGNDANPDAVNSYVFSLRAHGLPVLADELGINRTDSDPRIRANMWAAFCAGAAGTGTGTDLKAFQRFLAQSRIPYQRMDPSNGLVEGGGSSRFCLAESGRHYLVYSTTGSFTLSVTGTGLTARWFNPRDPNASLGAPFGVSSGASTFTPPDAGRDWALWVTDGANLNKGVTRFPGEATVVQVVVEVAEPN